MTGDDSAYLAIPRRQRDYAELATRGAFHEVVTVNSEPLP